MLAALSRPFSGDPSASSIDVTDAPKHINPFIVRMGWDETAKQEDLQAWNSMTHPAGKYEPTGEVYGEQEIAASHLIMAHLLFYNKKLRSPSWFDLPVSRRLALM